MALTFVQYVGNGSTNSFSIPFPFLNQTHVKVKLNGTDLHTPLDYSWLNDSTIQLEFSPTSLETVELYRQTPYTENLVEFQNGANLTKEELNLAVRQLLYVFQEYNERVRELVDGAALNVATGGGLVPVEGNDVFDDIVAHILDQYLSDTLQQRLADIDNNAESIIDQALSFADVQATVGSFENGLTDAQNTITALQAALASLADDVGTDIQNIVLQEAQDRIEGDTAILTILDLIGSISGDGTAFALDLETTTVGPNESLSQRLTSIKADHDLNAAAILNEQAARITADNAEANARLALAVIVGANEAAIDTESTTRADADTALSSSISATSAAASANTAAILAETTARADADNAAALQITGLISDVDDNAAAIITNASTAATETQAVADDVTALGVTVAANTAGIATEQTARANADASLASDITTVTAAVDGYGAQITAEATARASADSLLAADLTNLEARYGVKLNVNGHVTGFTQNNDGVTGEFKILTDVFKLIDPAGSSGQAGVEVFNYANGLIKMQNVKIGTAVIDNLSVTTGKLADNAASVVSSAYTASSIAINSGYLGLKNVQTLTHTSSGGAVTVMASVSVANTTSQNITGWGGIMRSDGSYLYGLTSFYFPSFSATMLSFSATETPGPGAETYTLRIGNAMNALNLSGRYRSLISLENIK